MRCWNCGSELETITAENVSDSGSCSIMCPNGHMNDAFLSSGRTAKPLSWWQNGLIFFGIAGGIIVVATLKQLFFGS